MNASTDPSCVKATAKSVLDRVRRVVATSRRLPLESVTSDSTFEQLGIDSLDRINLLFDLENEFDISIDDDQAKAITNISQMVVGIEHLLQTKKSASS